MALPLAADAFTAGAASAGSMAPARAGGGAVVATACCAAAGAAAGPADGAAACAPAAPAMRFAGAGATARVPVTPAMRIAAADAAAAVTAASSYSAFAADTCRSQATCCVWPGDWRCAASRCRFTFQMPHAPQVCGPEAATALRWPWLYEQEGGQEIAQAAPKGGRESD